MLAKSKALIQLHLAVLLFGFTAILGNIINMSALMIVWWRVVITVFTLLFLINIKKQLALLPRKQLLIYLGIGVIIALHWLAFYGSIKLGNSSLTLTCMATTSLFTALLEPFMIKRRFDKRELFFGLAIIPCIALIVSGVDKAYYLGIIVGLTSALLAAIFSILNKKHIQKADTIMITFIEMIGVGVFLTIIIPFVASHTDDFAMFPPSSMDWAYIIILAILCTTLAWVLSLYALKELTAFESNLVINMEPLYGIVLAALLLKEHKEMNWTFYLGSGLMLAIVLIYPKLRSRTEVLLK